jgi:hypothetical protein
LNENEAKITKKNIENLLIDLNENIEKNTQKEKQLQIKIERLTKQNEEFMIQNQKMLKEITNNTDYNKRLETIIYFILEMIITKQKSKNAEMKNFCLSNKSNKNINYGSKDISQSGTNDYPTLEHQMNGCLQKNGDIFDFCKNFINLYLEESNKSKLLLKDQKPINIMGNKRKRSENINSNNSNLSDLNKEANTLYGNSYKNNRTKLELSNYSLEGEEKKLDNNNDDIVIENNQINDDLNNNLNQLSNNFNIRINKEECKLDESDINDWNKDLFNNTQSSISDISINKDIDTFYNISI